MTHGLELKTHWRHGGVSLGSFIHGTDLSFANVFAHIGYDFLMIDAEHQPFNPQTLQGILLAIRASDSVPLVRVAANEPALIGQALGFGAEGVMAPLICTPEQGRDTVAACKFRPTGSRAVGGRAGPRITAGRRTTAVADFAPKTREDVAAENERTIVILQIEHIDAVERIDQIARVPGVDCLFVGQVDLAASMGLGWQVDHPAVAAATQQVLAAARSAGVPAGVGVGDEPAQVLRWIASGAQVFSLNADWMYMQRAARETLTAVRASLPRLTPGPVTGAATA